MRKSKTSVTLESEEPQRTSRRRFNKTVAATAIFAATPFANAAARAQTVTPGTTKETPAPPKPQTSPATAAAAATQKPSPLADAYVEVARVRFGEQATPEQLAQIKKDVAGMVRTADRLRAVKLQNGDEPDFVFSA